MEREPSYYEVALTNRQVVVGFVVLLACLFAAFLSGVWIGRDAAPASQTQIALGPATAAGADEKLEKLTFFGDRGSEASVAGARPAAPAPSEVSATSDRAASAGRPPAPAPSPAEVESEKLRETLEAEMSAHREAEPAAVEPAAPAPGARVRRTPAESSPPPAAPTTETKPAEAAPAVSAATSPPAAGGFWIQVYSSTNGERAREIAANLRRSKFAVRVLDSPVGSGTTYRVRVGPYSGRAEADRAAQRLRREFRLDTWVTDQP